MGTLASTFLTPTEEFTKGKTQYSTIFPFNNDRVEEYCQTYQLNAKEVMDLYSFFSKMDRANKGILTITNLLHFMHETHCSIIYPYLKGLFDLVDKQEEDRIDFFEWLTLTIEYCLMTEDQIYKLIFRIIDTNDDELISKKDILTFYSQEAGDTGRKIFPINYIKKIELMRVERADRISIVEFKSGLQNVPFLIYPAMRLQEDMREKILGEAFWVRLGRKLSDWESKRRRDEQIKKFNEEAEKKKKEKMVKKSKLIKAFWMSKLRMMEAQGKQRKRKREMMGRLKGRRLSDSYLYLEGERYFEDLKDRRRIRSQDKRLRRLDQILCNEEVGSHRKKSSDRY